MFPNEQTACSQKYITTIFPSLLLPSLGFKKTKSNIVTVSIISETEEMLSAMA